VRDRHGCGRLGAAGADADELEDCRSRLWRRPSATRGETQGGSESEDRFEATVMEKSGVRKSLTRTACADRSAHWEREASQVVGSEKLRRERWLRT